MRESIMMNMNMNIYMLYILVMKYGLTVSQVYDQCNDRYANDSIPYMGQFGSTVHPYPGPKERMRIWIMRTLINSPASGRGMITGPSKLGEFIAIHATDKIDLTWWDKIFTPIKKRIYK